jgi:hypothetical protein
MKMDGKAYTCLVLLAACLFAGAAVAQGTISGTLRDPAGTTTWFAEPVTVAALVLPDDAHPFNEMCAGTWQEALSALADGKPPESPLGGLVAGVTAEASRFVTAESDGQFRINELPYERRLALAARIDGVWWPASREYWLTPEQGSATIEIPFFTLDPNLSPTLALHRIETQLTMRGDLKFAGLRVIETIRVENTDPTRGAMVEIALDLLMPPDILARFLPSMYGSQLLFMQGTDALPAVNGDQASPLAPQSWKFGGADTMHGSKAVYNRGPQRSADNWHLLNTDGLHMLGAGETRFVENASPSGRSAKLVFRRPVPPALNGKPGTLVLRLQHRAGVPDNDPAAKVQLKRSFPLEVKRAEAAIGDGLTLAALIPEGHRKLYGAPSGAEFASTEVPALAAGNVAEIVFGLNAEAQLALGKMAGPQTPQASELTADKDEIKWNVLFQWLAAFFGIAFIGALVASVRWPREKQLGRLATLPASRAEVVKSLATLEADYRAGLLPASAYVEQRARLVNRVIEFDAKQSEEAEEGKDAP